MPAPAVGDFNGDCIPDLAVANFGDATVSLLLGTGSGSFGPQTTFAVGNGPNGIAVADFDGDGRADLAVANFSDGTVSVLLGSGTGSFASQSTFAVGAGPYAVAVADFNGDGAPDIAVPCYGDSTPAGSGRTVSVLMGSGNGGSGAKSFSVGAGPDAIAVGDFTGDGHPDIAVTNYGNINGNGSPVSILLDVCN
jgi:hypothetical protein